MIAAVQQEPALILNATHTFVSLPLFPVIDASIKNNVKCLNGYSVVFSYFQSDLTITALG